MKSISLLKFIPQEVKELVLIKTFTTYSFAVLYSSLVLYMTSDVGLSSQHAAGIVGVFISLNFILHFLGGYLGGKFISNRGLLLLGVLLEFLGIVVLKSHLLIGLGIFLTGSGLYVTSINAILLQKYTPEDSRREIASFWLYSGMNLGFFIGHSVGGYFHLHGHYNWLFDSAIITSLIAIYLICANWRNLSDINTDIAKKSFKSIKLRFITMLLCLPPLILLVIASITYHSQAGRLVMISGAVIFCLTLLMALKQPEKEDKNKVFAFLILVVAALIFWSLFFIGPMGMTLFIHNYVNNQFIGITIPPQWFNNINTGIIVIGGPFLATWFKRIREQGSDLSYPFLFAVALLCIGTAYIILPVGIRMPDANGLISVYWVVISYVLQTTGELFLSPVGMAMIGKLAPQGKQGLLLGIWAMVLGIASMVSKYLSQMMTVSQLKVSSYESIQSYSDTFSIIGWSAFVFGCLLFSLVPYVKKLIGNESQDNSRHINNSLATDV